MKKSVVMALVLGFGLVNVASATEITTVADCTLAKAMMDYGVEVQVKQTQGPILVGGANQPSLNAVVVESLISGPREFGTFEVTQKQSANVGAPRVYVGKDFELQIDVDTLPVNGRIRAHLNADAQNRRLSEDMLCTLN